MKGCIAPSEVPGVTVKEASQFGAMAEELIYADFCMRYACGSGDVFRDANNPAAYLYFLRKHNPRFTQSVQTDYYTRLRGAEMLRIPDFLVHTFAERAFYEVKPDSQSGMSAGVEKVGYLGATYPFFRLPYTAGLVFRPRDHVVARLGTLLEAKLHVRLAGPGLLVYKICVVSDGTIDMATLILLLRYIIREMNRQRRSSGFVPVDLAPIFARDQQLGDLARTLGLPAVAAAAAASAATVGWKWFWKAVAKRYAPRAAAAALLAAADGPLPVGDLIAAGMLVWTIVDIVRLNEELWRDARRLRAEGA